MGRERDEHREGRAGQGRYKVKGSSKEGKGGSLSLSTRRGRKFYLITPISGGESLGPLLQGYFTLFSSLTSSL